MAVPGSRGWGSRLTLPLSLSRVRGVREALGASLGSPAPRYVWVSLVAVAPGPQEGDPQALSR